MAGPPVWILDGSAGFRVDVFGHHGGLRRAGEPLGKARSQPLTLREPLGASHLNALPYVALLMVLHLTPRRYFV